MSNLSASLVPETLRRGWQHAPTPADAHASFGSHGAVLWCDIARYSPMAKALVAQGNAGVEKLSSLLQRHFDRITDIVHRYGGDCIEFYGDGVMVVFPADAPARLATAAAQALSCARSILDECRGELAPGLRLSLHLHLTAGRLQLLDFGGVGGERLHATAGDALAQLAQITRDQAPNQVIVSPALAALIEAPVILDRLPNGGLVLDVPPPTAVAAPQTDTEAPPTPPGLEAFLAPPVRHGIAIGALRWTAEVRHVIAVFVKLPGLDQAAADFPARIHELARQVQQVCRRHEGVLRCLAIDDKGVGFQLLFGLPPMSHHDDALRALKSARELHGEFRLRGIACSIGIAAGDAFIGVLGNDLRRHYAVIGDAVNLASRLSHLSDAAVLCDEASVRDCTDRARFTALPRVTVKGWAEPLPVWSPEDGSETRAPTAPIGRDDVLAAIENALATACAGRTASCLLVGEAGMGKSTVIEAARRSAAAQGLTVLIGESARIEQNTPFQALRSVYSRLLGLDALADNTARRSHLEAVWGAQHGDRLCLLNAVIPLDFRDSPWAAGLLPSERVASIRSLLIELLQASARTQPLLLVIEDAHWADDESLLLLERLGRRLAGAAILISARPPMLALNDLVEGGATLIDLRPLSAEECAALIATQLGAATVAADVVSSLHERAAGNPFFAAELARYLFDAGELERSADGDIRHARSDGERASRLPTTVRATITSRVDNMAPSARLSLKIESVAGLRGPLAAVEHVHPLHVDSRTLAEHLQSQQRMGLVDLASVDGAPGFEFRHDITREVVYDLVLPEVRQLLHADFARWYESTRAGDLAACYPVLAAHWAAALHPARAAGYLEREAVRVFSNGHAQQALATGLAALGLLGVALPKDAAAVAAAIGTGMGELQGLIGNRSPADHATLPLMTDAEATRAVATLLTVAPLAFQSNRVDLYALASITAMQRTLVHGNGADAAQVYSLYSVVHGALTGDRAGAAAWSELALMLDGRDGRRRYGEVGFVHTWFHSHWQRPLRDSLAISLDAAEQGLAAGNLLYACFNLAGHVIYQQAAGVHLGTVIDTARRHLARNGGRVKNSAFHLIHEMQVAKALSGQTEDLCSFSDAEHDEARDLASILDTPLSNQIGYFLVSKLKVHALAGHWRQALDWAERAEAARQAFGGQTAEFELVQYAALAFAGQALETAQPLDLRGLALAEQLRAWAALCPANFVHKARLVDGALALAAGDAAGALALLVAAATAAGGAGYAHDHALALEWAARAASPDDAPALRERAADAWQAWGAAAMAQRLRSS
ncbi:AAA and adenylate/guanylate cyclase domain-containing protein [Nevskia sp.]|uniref:AAA and adenylate/guanylate cyclase domain-containing protein n=1 Tax=Nevskia sp. TaxID=1929292 RepID=UPI0025FD3CA0|nr:AAA and adenylate/guanylate cyclase domain-containing protein [Nevskia sp.]